MINLIATAEVYYSGCTRKPGDAFEASAADAQILVGIGKARPANAPLLTRQMKAEAPPPAPPPPAPADPAGSKKRRYARRDMRAED